MNQESEVYQEQESKASDPVRIAEPVATSEINPEVEQTEGQFAAKVHSPAQEPVGSVRIAEPDSARESESDSNPAPPDLCWWHTSASTNSTS